MQLTKKQKPMKGSNSKKLKKYPVRQKNLRQTFPGNNSNNSFLAFVVTGKLSPFKNVACCL